MVNLFLMRTNNTFRSNFPNLKQATVEEIRQECTKNIIVGINDPYILHALRLNCSFAIISAHAGLDRPVVGNNYNTTSISDLSALNCY